MDHNNVIITEITDNDDMISEKIDEIERPKQLVIETISEDKPMEIENIRKKKTIVRDREVFKQRDVEEEETITEKTKTVVKKIKEKRPSFVEETIPDETIYEFNIGKYPAVVPTVLKTSKTTNEVIAQQKVIELSTDINKIPEKAKLSIITRNAAESIVIQVEEKEQTQKEALNIKKFKANSVLEVRESISTDHPDTQSPIEEMVKPIDIVPCVATKDIIPKESVMIREIHPDQTIGEGIEYKQENKEATVTVITHSQKIVTEFVPSTKEGEIQHEKLPQKKKATQEYVEHESINVMEVNEAQNEGHLKADSKPTPVRPSIEYPLNEQLTVSESHSEIQPEMYYPAVIVPIEVADKVIVPSTNSITVFEIEPSEKEVKYNPLKAPVGFQADVSIIPEKSIQVTESNIQEKETKIPEERKPEKSFATSEIISQSSLIVNAVHQQESEKTFTAHLPESHTATLTLNNANKVCTSLTVEMNETESDLKIPIIPEKRHTTSSISGLEVPDITEVILNETESDFTTQPALELLPDTSFTENHSYTVTETTTEDFPADLKTNVDYQTYEAESNFEEVVAKEISQVDVQESHVPLDETPKPTFVRPEASFAPIQTITVEQTIIAEQEQTLILKEHPETHKSMNVPTHSLQAVVIEEITPENSIENLEEISKDVTKRANVNFVDDQSIVVKEVSTYESESNLKLNDMPKNVYAKPAFSGHDVAETIEVISSDALEQLNVEKYPNDRAKLEQVPHEACISEETMVNELENIFVNEKKKQLKTVNVTIDEVVGVNISEQPVYEKEMKSVDRLEPNTKNAISAFVPIEIADRTEIVTGDYTLDLLQPKVSKAHAHHQPGTFESVILYETDVSEKEQEMSDKKLPQTYLADTSVVVEEAIEVTEIISDNRPEDISVSSTPKGEKAQTNIIPLKSLEEKNVITCENVEKVKEENAVTAVAHVSQKPFKSLETSLMVPVDSENVLYDFVMPESKKAETSYTESELPISVVEIHTQDKEKDLKPDEIPTHTLDKQDIILEECHTTSETMVCSTTNDFDERIPESVYALTTKSPQVAIEQLETALLEREGKLLDEEKSQERRADLTYKAVKGIQITEQVQLDTKDELVIESKPLGRKSNVTITGQDIAETLETKVESPIEELKIEFPKQQLAHFIQDQEVHGLKISEIITQENETSLEIDQKYDSKIVDISVEDNVRSYEVMEILPGEKESQFPEEIKPIHHHAEPDIISCEGLQVDETNVSIREEKLEHFEFSTKVVSPVIEPLECIEISEVVAEELEDNTNYSLEPKAKHATSSFNENTGLVIKSTITNDKEIELIIDKTEMKTATKVSNIIDLKVPEHSEKMTLEFVQPIKDQKENLYQATPEHVILESINTTIVNTQDSETVFDQTPEIALKNASMEYETGQTVDITEVLLGESESNLVPKALPQSHIATSSFSETQQVASNLEILPQNKVDDFNVQTVPSAVNLVPRSMEVYSFEVTETTCHETETPFKSVKNLTKTCDFTVQSDQNIQVSEVVTNEFEEIFNGNKTQKSSEASIVFDENQTVTIEEIETADDVVPINENVLKSENAKTSLEPLQGVSVIEIRPEETEIPSEKPIKPLPKHVTQILPVNKSLNVTSTVAVEKENVLNEIKPDISQIAQISSVYSPKTVVQSQESIVQISTTEIKPTKLNEISLVPSQIPYDSISQIEISPFEKESVLNVILKDKKEKANLNIDTINILDTTEIITGDKESIYTPVTKPMTRHALLELTDGQPVGKVYEVKLEDSSSDLITPAVITCSAVSGQEVVHGVTITDITTQDKEELFEGEFKPTSSVAKVNVENEKETKTVTEIVTQEMEGHVKKLDIPSTKRAQIEITSGQEVAEKTETISNTALGTLNDFVTKSLTAVPVQDTHESIQFTMTVPEDKEKPLDSNVVYEKSTAKLKFKESKSINVTQVIVDDKEGKYIVPELPKTQTAGKNILQNEAAETTLVLADQHLTEFDKHKPREELANVTHEIHANITQTEITVHESEKYLQPTEISSINAELSLIPNKSVIITEVITDDNDEKLPEKHEKKTQQATPSLTEAYEVPQVSEIGLSITTSDVVVPVVDADNAIVSHSQFHDTAISTETNTLEKENTFKQIPKFDKLTAEIKFKEDHPLNVAEIVANESEKPLKIDEHATKQASMIQSTFNVVTISENLSIETEQNLKSLNTPEGQTANVTFENNLNVQVSEVNAIDKENNLLAPILKTQTATIPEISTQSVVNITEVITSMSSNDLPQMIQPEQVRASETHLPCQSILQTELNVSESEGVLEKVKTTEETATIKTDTLENIICTEQVVSEKEGDLQKSEKLNLKHANVSIEEIKTSVIVSNVNSEDKETDLIVKPTRKTSVAKVTSENLEAINNTEQQTSEKEYNLNIQFPKNESANVIFEGAQSSLIVSDVISEDKEEYLKVNKTNYSTARVMTENHESLITNEQTVSEKEETITSETKPDKKTALITIEKPKEGAIISEVTSNEKETELHENLHRKPSLANVSTDELQSIITSETQILSKVEEIKLLEKGEQKVANIELDEHKHLTVEELVTNETEGKIQHERPKTYNITPKLSEMLPLESNEIISEVKTIRNKDKKLIQDNVTMEKSMINKKLDVKDSMKLETEVELIRKNTDKKRASVTDTTISTGIYINIEKVLTLNVKKISK